MIFTQSEKFEDAKKKHCYTDNYRLSNTNPTKNWGMNSGAPEG